MQLPITFVLLLAPVAILATFASAPGFYDLQGCSRGCIEGDFSRTHVWSKSVSDCQTMKCICMPEAVAKIVPWLKDCVKENCGEGTHQVSYTAEVIKKGCDMDGGR
jgi:hypothetical protein